MNIQCKNNICKSKHVQFFFFFHYRPMESFSVRFLLSSFHPMLLLCRAPSSSPLHSCCAVSSDHVCQVLSSCSTSLVFYSLVPCGGRDGRLDWLWHPLKWMPVYWLKAISSERLQCFAWRRAATGLIKLTDSLIHGAVQRRWSGSRLSMGFEIRWKMSWNLLIWLCLTD